MPPAAIAIELFVQLCSVVYIHAAVTVVFEELRELVDYIIITFETIIGLFELVLDAKTGSVTDFLI